MRGGGPRIAVTCVLLALGRDATAQSTRVRLSVVRLAGAESCAEQGELAARLRAHFTSDLLDPAAERSLEVLLQREGNAWVARTLLREGAHAAPAVRTLSREGPSCAALTEPLGFTLALAIDPFASAAPRPRSPEPAPALAPRATPTATSWASKMRLLAQLSGVYGPLPGFAFGGGLEASAGLVGPLRLAFTMLQTQELAVRGAGRDFAFTFTGASALLCAGGSYGRVAGAGCAGALLELTHAAGQSSPDAVSPSVFAGAAALAAGRLTLRVAGPLVLELGLEVGVNLRPWRFLAQPESASEPSPPETVTLLSQGYLYLRPTLGLGLLAL